MTSQVTIHQSGAQAGKFQVVSYGNGTAYAFQFGEAGSPMRTLFLQGDDASQIRAEFDAIEAANPDTLTRDAWLEVLDPYL